MDKRYQVFVSSTYTDLKEERQHVIQALMEMDCIPAGMELFPAADEEQWEFIKKVIDDCDYYLLVIGGRYGSLSSDGISYTEKEFDYAIERKLKIIALIHEEPENIPLGKSEPTPELRAKLIEFKNKVQTGRLVKFWKTTKEIPGLVALSLTKTIKMYPAIGWVRANQVSNNDLLIEINQLRKENTKLSHDYEHLISEQTTIINDIADITSNFIIHGTYDIEVNNGFIGGTDYKEKEWEIEISWKEIFSIISPYLLELPNENLIQEILTRNLVNRKKLTDGEYYHINGQDFKTISIQLKAYGLINIECTKIKDTTNLIWSLTENGEKLMIEDRVIR